MLIALQSSSVIAEASTFGYWLVRFTKGVDIRTVGSHNLGATNVWRTYGWRYGLPVMLLDVLKAFVPVVIATHVSGELAGASPPAPRRWPGMRGRSI